MLITIGRINSNIPIIVSVSIYNNSNTPGFELWVLADYEPSAVGTEPLAGGSDASFQFGLSIPEQSKT